MANSLDDFFAKKDKKRGKDKSKAAFSSEALVKELEEGARQADYPVRKEIKTSTAIELLGLDADDADWRDFEDIERRDYTGLKVKEMSIQDQNDEEQRRLAAEQTETASESVAWTKPKDNEPSTASIAAALSAQTDNNSDIKQANSNVSKSDTVDSADSKTEEPIKPEQAESNSNETGQNSSENKGDKPSAKYVPRPQRLLKEGEVKLEPIKMSQTKSSSSRQVAVDISDTHHFPSLG